MVRFASGRTPGAYGNAHLVALVACDPDLTLEKLAEAAGRSDFIRVWRDGWEAGSGQACAYDIYVPLDADVSRIPDSRLGVDGFKEPPEDINVIPPHIAFDSLLLALYDRGRTLAETAECMRGCR